MSSYNNVEKIKYASEDCVVNLEEYIVFENERAEEKYVVFKFANNVNQQLLGMEFEVSQYDIESNLIEKSVVLYNKFLAKPCQSFVPKAKLKVNYACKTLSVRLIQAAFDRFVWKEGQYLDNSYKFEHYARDEDTEAAKRAPAAPVKVKAQKPVPAPKRRKGKLPFKAKNATRKNIAKFPGVFNAITCILALVAIGLSTYFFVTKSTSFAVDDVYYEIVDNGVAVAGYDGEDKNLTIPAKVGEYTVTRIKEKAFKNSDIESVKFDSSRLYIEEYAFEGCANLKSVASSAETTVFGYAFGSCTALTTVVLPNSTLLKNSFNGCSGVAYFEFGSVSAETLDDIFGGEVPKDATIVSNGSKPNEDPEPDEDEGEVKYDASKIYAYGELYGKGVAGYERYDDFETVKGEIITVNPKASESLTIKQGVTAISENVYDKLGAFTSLSIEGDLKITEELASAFKNVTLLTISSTENITSDGLKNLGSLQKFTSPALYYGLYAYLPDSVYSLVVTGNNEVDGNYLANLSNVTEIEIQSTVPSVDHYAFRLSLGLKKLTVPCYENKPINEQYEIKKSLDYLEILPSQNCTGIPANAFRDINAVEIVVANGFTSCGINILNYNYVEKLTLPSGIDYQAGTIGSNCVDLSTVDVYFSNFDISYSDFNKSYEYTKDLIIRCDTLDGSGFLTDAYTYLSSLELYAAKATVSLNDFVNGSLEPVETDKINYYIKELPENFEESVS